MKKEFGQEMAKLSLWIKTGTGWNLVVTTDDQEYIDDQESRYIKALAKVKVLPYGVKP